MKLLNKLNVATAGLAVYAMSAVNAMAAGATPAPIPTYQAPIPNLGRGVQLFTDIGWYVSFLFWALTIIFIFYAAFLYLTAGGAEDKVKKANKQLIYAVIAIVVALFAYGLPLFVDTTLRGSQAPNSPSPNDAYYGPR